MASSQSANGSTHWMVFVNWATVVWWKHDARLAVATPGGVYPYQYASDRRRFLQIKAGDVLWVVTTPRFDARGRPSTRGRARPPAVMARLRVKGKCCNRYTPLHETEDDDAAICSRHGIVFCDRSLLTEGGVHPASSAWSIVVVGDDQDADGDHDPLNVTYPVLYNFFGALHRLGFETDEGVTDLGDYLEYVESGEYLHRPTQPGPYGRFGQRFRNLRKLTAEAAEEMDKQHRRAVRGQRLFFSYKWDDVERIAAGLGQARAKWVAELNKELEAADYSSWLDHHQILPEQDLGGLLDEVLTDAVRQTVIFVALLTEDYGTGWSGREWNVAHQQAANQNRRDRLHPIALDCGGDPGRLDPPPETVHRVAGPLTPKNVVRAIQRAGPRP